MQLDAQWLSGDDIWWTFDRTTKVWGFEVKPLVEGDSVSGQMLAVLFAGENQLIPGADLPIEMFLNVSNRVVLDFPILQIGEKLELVLNDFVGQIRPIGEQLDRK